MTLLTRRRSHGWLVGGVGIATVMAWREHNMHAVVELTPVADNPGGAG
jgi:hypothetical protein